uniref:Uncharacterized protein n=3 Tax=Vitis vinifera TaxID=29760 RepID=A5AZW0_VITVI|nr:hypothetical protein VITISV_025506 [Vitis vinifera]
MQHRQRCINAKSFGHACQVGLRYTCVARTTPNNIHKEEAIITTQKRVVKYIHETIRLHRLRPRRWHSKHRIRLKCDSELALTIPTMKLPKDKNENNMRNEVAESDYTKMNVQGEQNPGSSENVLQVKIVDSKSGENIVQGGANEDMDTSGEVNMEASITPDDVIRAGGFGARDDISSFLPVASDSTDFEASLRDARDYEEPQGDIYRPGLGWTETTKSG